MNGVEKYRDSLTLFGKSLNYEEMNYNDGIEKGFNAAIALDLPVRFAKWLKTLDNGTEGFDPHTKQVIPSIGFSPYDCFTDNLMTEEQLYQYWLENIYKPEL